MGSSRSLALSWSALLLASSLLPASIGRIVVLNDTNFDRLTANQDFFIDIYAPWCSHCRQLEPVWERVARNLEGHVTLAKIDGTENPVLLHRFYVAKFPTLVLLRNGQTWKFEGVRSEKELSTFALEDWKRASPWPFYMAPNSKFGRAVGLILGLPVRVKQWYHFLHHTLRLPQLAVVVVFLAGPILLGVAAICLLDFWHTSHPREGRLHDD